MPAAVPVCAGTAASREALAGACAARVAGLYEQAAALLTVGDLARAAAVIARAERQATQISRILNKPEDTQLRLL